MVDHNHWSKFNSNALSPHYFQECNKKAGVNVNCFKDETELLKRLVTLDNILRVNETKLRAKISHEIRPMVN